MSAIDPDLARSARALMLARFGLMPETFSEAELGQRLRAELGTEAAIADALRHAADEPLDGADLQRLISALTIRESSFLRHRSWFEALFREFIDPIVRHKRAAGMRHLVLWSAGCATGEEAYTLALMAGELLPDGEGWSVAVTGTDICAAALEQARRGHYRPWSLRELPADRQAAHFARRDGAAVVGEHLRAMADFRLVNLMDDLDGAPRAADVILCRNVLMHLTPPARAAVAQRLVQRLAPGGVLATAPSEASPDLFRPLVRHDRGELLVFRAGPSVGEAAATPPAAIRPAGRRAPPRAAARPAAAPAPMVAAPSRAVPVVPLPSLENLVDRLVAAGDLAAAAAACARAADAAPFDPVPLRLLAAVQETGNDLAEACRTLQRLLYLDEGDCEARFRLAVALRRSGREAASRRELRAVIALASGREDAPPDPLRARILRAAQQMSDGAGIPAIAIAAGRR